MPRAPRRADARSPSPSLVFMDPGFPRDGAPRGAGAAGTLLGPGDNQRWNSPQPAREILPHESVVGEIGVLAIDPVDLLAPPGAPTLLRIEAPDALQQALA